MRTLQADPSKRQPGDQPRDYQPITIRADRPDVYGRLTHSRMAAHKELPPDPYVLTMGEYARYLQDVGDSYDPPFAAWLRSRA